MNVWLNDGTDHFKSRQHVKFGYLEAVSVGDVTGDGLVDVSIAGPDSYQVWRGDGNGRFQSGQSFTYR